MFKMVKELVSRPILFLAFLIVLLLAGFGVQYVYYFNTQYEETDVRAIGDCFQTSSSIQCARPYVKHLLSSKTPSDVLQVFEKKFTAQQCHYLGHLVGQTLYQSYQAIEPALAECTRTCDSACVHGAVGEAFVEETGLSDQSYDTEHLSVDDIRTAGTRLCKTIGGCHGVGHVLYERYQQFQPALDVCTSISKGSYLEGCYRGVFMEYSDSLVSKSVFATTTARVVPNPEKMCDGLSGDQQLACFWHLPNSLFSTLNLRGTTTTKPEVVDKVKAHCETLPMQARLSCVAGIGAYDYPLAFSDSVAAHAACADFPTSAEVFACGSGMLEMAMEYQRVDAALSYCKLATTLDEKATCYKTVFSLALVANTTVEKIKNLCDASDPVCAKVVEATTTSAR